jgi:hypothetical protein
VLPRVATLRGSARSIRCGGKCNFLYGGVWPFGASAAALAGSHDGACRERERGLHRLRRLQHADAATGGDRGKSSTGMASFCLRMIILLVLE